MLARIVAKALAKQPDQRYASMAEMRQDLLACQDMFRGADTTISHPAWDQARNRHRPRSWWLVGLACVLAVVVVGAWQWLRSEKDTTAAGSPSLAVLPFEDLVAAEAGQLTAGLVGLLNVGLIENCPVRVVSTEYLHDLKRRLFGVEEGAIATDQALAVAREAGATLLLTGQVGRLGDLPYVAWRLVDAVTGANVAAARLEAADLLTLADGIIAGVLPAVSRRFDLAAPAAPAPVSRLTTRSADAYWHYLVGVQALAGFRREEAERELTLAAEMDSTFALPHLTLSQLFYYGARSRARDHWAQAWQLKENLGVQDRLRLEVMRERLQAPTNYRLIIQLYRDMQERWPDSRQVLNDLSEILAVNLGNYAAALAVARQGLRLYPDDLVFGMRVASGLRNTGRHQEALAAAHRFTRQHPFEPNAWDELGTAYLAVAKLDSAVAAYERALTLDPSFWFASLNLAACAYSRGDVAAAAAKVEEVVSRLKQPPNSRLITHNSNVMGLAFYYREMGQGEQATALFEAARQHGTGAAQEQAFDRLLLSLFEAAQVVERSAWLAAKYPDLDPTVQAAQEGLAWVALDSLPAARAALAVATESYQRLGSGRFERDHLAVLVALTEGDTSLALELIDQLWADGMHFPGPYDITLRDLQARVLHQAGRLDQAIALLDEALHLYAGHHEGRYLRGRLLLEAGEVARARQDLEQFLTDWSEADRDWNQVAEARRLLAGLH
jgi:tetratricopeptide (TPR) repeat protein